MSPDAWSPYPDAAGVLGALREHGLAVAVVSNIGWDLRPACEALGLNPREVLMVGDDRRAEGGAAALGSAVHIVDHLPVHRRPEDLLPVLDRAGIARPSAGSAAPR